MRSSALKRAANGWTNLARALFIEAKKGFLPLVGGTTLYIIDRFVAENVGLLLLIAIAAIYSFYRLRKRKGGT